MSIVPQVLLESSSDRRRWIEQQRSNSENIEKSCKTSDSNFICHKAIESIRSDLYCVVMAGPVLVTGHQMRSSFFFIAELRAES